MSPWQTFRIDFHILIKPVVWNKNTTTIMGVTTLGRSTTPQGNCEAFRIAIGSNYLEVSTYGCIQNGFTVEWA